MLKQEIWKPLSNYEGLYEISNKGQIKSVGRYIKSNHNNTRFQEEKIRKLTVNNKGYITVRLCKNGKYKTFLVHRLVAETIVSVVPTWRNGNNTSTGFMDDVVSSVSTSSSDVGSNVNNYILSKMMWCTVYNGDNFSIMIGRGNSRYTASCDVFVKYTKL